MLFGKDKILEKEQKKYNKDASEYLGNQQKTQGLLNKALKLANEKKGSLGAAWDNLQLFFELVKAYSKGEYRHISTTTIITVLGA
ncbi:MAG: methyltransferase type 11, partial [Bacillus sp. (in: Bacteria)]|nr:methyltransferase type 11 [Bacillus sp. (in: firmicutes)]